MNTLFLILLVVSVVGLLILLTSITRESINQEMITEGDKLFKQLEDLLQKYNKILEDEYKLELSESSEEKEPIITLIHSLRMTQLTTVHCSISTGIFHMLKALDPKYFSSDNLDFEKIILQFTNRDRFQLTEKENT